MRTLRLLLVCLFMGVSGTVAASAITPTDFEFNQDRMQLSSTAIYVISSFDNTDYITAYSYKGNLIWEAPFHAKVLSWKLAGDYVLVFSKARHGNKTFLTCIDKFSGLMIWQKP